MEKKTADKIMAKGTLRKEIRIYIQEQIACGRSKRGTES